MSDKKISQLTPVSGLAANDLLVVVSSPGGLTDTYNITYQDFFANVNTLTANSISLMEANTPANSSSTHVGSGVLFYDANYLYVSTSNNVVKRVALNLF